MKIDDRKVEAIKQMSAPKDKKGLQSFRDMVSYLKRYSVQLMKLSTTKRRCGMELGLFRRMPR